MSLRLSLAPMVRTNNFTVILDLLQNKGKKNIKKIQYFNRKKKITACITKAVKKIIFYSRGVKSNVHPQDKTFRKGGTEQRAQKKKENI